MTRAIEFCDQHGPKPLRPLLKGQGSKECLRKAEGFFEIVEPLGFAGRFTFAKHDACECSDAITRSRKPDPTGICGVRLIEDWIEPSGTKLATPMPVG